MGTHLFSLSSQITIRSLNSSKATLTPSKCFLNVRQFSISGQEAVKLIKENVSDVQVGKDFIQSTSSTSTSNKTGKKEAPAKAIKVLLHADRRPKALPPFRSTDPIQTHFGPALIGCHGSYLEKISRESQLGKGDLGILQLQRDHPAKTVDVPISIEKGLALDKAFGFLLRMAPIAGMSVAEPVQWKAAEILQNVWRLFEKFEGVWFTFELAFDGQQISINSPFLEFDDFGVKRVPELQQLYESRPRDQNTAKAEDGGLFYIKLPKEGNVGSFGYGAGNAMATMDGLSLVGGKPANFLDGGGGANKQNARLAIETLNRDDSVKAIFVNTFGGITQTDVVAEGIIEAVKENSIKKPIVARILGTGAERAKELLSSSDIHFTIQDDFKEAARCAVERANG